MRNLIFHFIIFLWKINPFKKHFLDSIRENKTFFKKIKYDFWYNGHHKVNILNTTFYLTIDRFDSSSKHIYFNGLENSWDAVSSKVWALLSKDANTILDVGSNIGLYALIAKKINSNARVIAFEPALKLIEKLHKNISLNKLDIEVKEVALSNIDGVTYFYDLPNQTAVASIKLNRNIEIVKNHLKYKVKVNRLDSLIKKYDLKNIDLVSIDVEMNEPEVLEGFGDLIKLYHPNFIIEVLNNEIAKKIESYFKNMNYKFFKIDEQAGLIYSERIIHENENINHSFNFLILRNQDYEKIKHLIL